MELSEKIKKLRKQYGLSQQQLADKIDAHVTHISRIETDKYKPSVDFLKKMADVFEVTIDYLIDQNLDDFQEVRIEDKTLAERIRLVDTLDEKDKAALLQIINTMLTKKRMKDFLENEFQPS